MQYRNNIEPLGVSDVSLRRVRLDLFGMPTRLQSVFAVEFDWMGLDWIGTDSLIGITVVVDINLNILETELN